jgi:regulator of RNase E activity RraA
MSILSASKRLTVGLLGACVCAAVLMATLEMRADSEKTAADYAAKPAAMLEAYRHVEVASVSDATEQLLHQKRFLSHHMRPIFPAKFVGTALTVKLVKREGADPAALNGMLEAIDRGGKDSVYVMEIEGGDDIAGMGGLMGTAMYSRGYAGAVIGGGVRDLPQLMRINFPVFSTGVVPSTAVGHYRFAAMNVPIVCDGVDVAPNDIVVADADGVVVVPRAKAVDVLQLAQSLDNKEHSTYPFIEKFHSIVEAVKQFGRI